MIRRRILPIAALLALSAGAAGCLVKPACYSDADCPSGQLCRTGNGKCEKPCRADADCRDGEYCETNTGRCKAAECFTGADCLAGELCREHRCVPAGELICPFDMVSIDNLFCMDIYEASRPDATATSFGSDESRATSRKGVWPWFSHNLDSAVARLACQNAGKRLCTEEEWVFSCRGAQDTEYTYGDDYDPVICNGIDTFCYCEAGSVCEDRDPCPYPHCYDTCRARFTHMPTGSFPDCVSSWGVYDINGNVWELIDTDDGVKHFKGGAFNCSDSETLHRCDYDGDWGPSAQGFRCCSDGERREGGDGG